ncbi:uncharacterized protein DUF3883 [Roseimicrobium gellanilyticum]|uniref:Uncharacterized protein DUF3883 n=1 Tax=Roseimicrobium gellanilyticum TaxID=748857 RepID=A0A366H6K3_9BACT|nr:DUF3883 domain-containing protein [Roseimicrobium gellanilyticum]RBP37634.1 uncharacterized protein DUF3883 [Roseimicrobium gellanilyticum]
MSESENWSQNEVEAIVADYFAMWEKELRGETFNKAEHNRILRKLIPNRSRGSVEKKHQNISAVLWHLGYPFIDGYKPLPRYQNLLRDVIETRLKNQIVINRLVSKKVHAPATLSPIPKKGLNRIVVPPPKRKEIKELLQEEARKKTAFIRRNYLEIEAMNHSLGRAGEEFILHYERERLRRAGKKALAGQVEHVSDTRGDHMGYDILSFETDGRERLIEAKTTRFGQMSRFFASANEVEFSDANKKIYFLYRLFDFERNPRFFVLGGSLRESCNLTPFTYSVVPT